MIDRINILEIGTLRNGDRVVDKQKNLNMNILMRQPHHVDLLTPLTDVVVSDVFTTSPIYALMSLKQKELIIQRGEKKIY